MIVVKFLKRLKDRLIVKWFCWSPCAQECHVFVRGTSHSTWWWTRFRLYQSWGRVSFLATNDYKISPNLVCLSLCCSVAPAHFNVYLGGTKAPPPWLEFWKFEVFRLTSTALSGLKSFYKLCSKNFEINILVPMPI